MAKDLRFPLFERAERLGALEGGSALISARTATGKSHIGREAIRRGLARRDLGTHVYLVSPRTGASVRISYRERAVIPRVMVAA